MTHLTSDELIDAMEGLLAGDRQAHLDACETCRQQLADLSGVLGEAKQSSVPEPSPMFWQHFSARVNTAIDTELESAWPAWLRWQVLLPLGAVAMIILALMLSVPKQEPAIEEEPPIAAEAPSSGDNWVMLANLVGDIDLDTAVAAGVVIEPGDAEEAVLELTAEEQQELTRLLRAELMRAKS